MGEIYDGLQQINWYVIEAADYPEVIVQRVFEIIKEGQKHG